MRVSLQRAVDPRWLIAVSAASQVATVILLGTVLAVYVGRNGSPFAVSMVFAGYFFAKTVFGVVWGAVADVTANRKAVLLGTTLLMTASVLPLFFISSVWGMVGVRILFGVFSAGYLPIMLTIVSQKGGTEFRGHSLGFFGSMRSIGFTAAQLLSGLLLGILYPRVVFAVIAGIGAIATVSVMLVSDPSSTPTAALRWSELPAAVASRISPLSSGVGHATSNGLQWLYVVIVMRNVTWHGLESLLPVFILFQIGGSEFAMGVLLALAPLGEIFGMYFVGRGADRLGRKPLIRAGAFGHGLVCIIAVAAGLADSTAIGLLLVGVAMAVKAASYSSFMSGTTAFIGDVAAGDRESELMGLRTTAIGVGGVLGPLLIGAIATLANYSAAFLLAAAVAVFATVLVEWKVIESHQGWDPTSNS